MMEDALADGDRRMRRAVDVLKEDLATVRTGRASPSLVENVHGRVLWFSHAFAATCADQCLGCAPVSHSALRPQCHQGDRQGYLEGQSGPDGDERWRCAAHQLCRR